MTEEVGTDLELREDADSAEADLDQLIAADGTLRIPDAELSEEHLKLLEEVDRESKTRRFEAAALKRIFAWLAFIITLYHLYTAAFGPPLTLKHRSLHVCMMLMLAFMLYLFNKRSSMKTVPWYDWLLIALSAVPPIYVWSNYLGVVERAGNPNLADTLVATLLILLVLEAARRVTGWALPTLSMIFLAYALWGRNIPGMFRHRGYTWDFIANHLFANTEGIYGTSVSVAASYIILFIIFGCVMSKSGMGQFFNDIAFSIAGGSKGGPAKVAVIASGLLGSINGSAIANVVTTGAFTIPLMKKTGYSKEFAGAVEATASVGGQVLPPVMGAAAFIMAEMLGMKYSQIAIAAAIPALLYYLGIIIQVHMRACKLGLVGISKENLPQTGKILRERGYLVLPIVFLIYMLFFSGATVIYAAFFTIVLTLALHVGATLIQTIKAKASLADWLCRMAKDIFEAFVEGTKSTVSVAVACACVGIIVGVISKTGFGLNMVNAIIKLGGQSLLLTLVFTMVTCIILGMGVPSIPAYIITATIAAPALIQLNIPALAAHMFTFYFAMFANLTPPVALAAFAGAGISGGDPMKTGFTAVKLALAGFVVPYMFIYGPELLLINTTVLMGTWVAIAAGLGVFLLAVSIEGYFLTAMSWWLRLVGLAGALCLINSAISSDIVGLAALALVLVAQRLRSKKNRNIPEPAANKTER